MIDMRVLIFKERAGKPGGGKGILIGKEASFTLSTLTDEAVCYAVDSHPGDSRFELSGGGCDANADRKDSERKL